MSSPLLLSRRDERSRSTVEIWLVTHMKGYLLVVSCYMLCDYRCYGCWVLGTRGDHRAGAIGTAGAAKAVPVFT